MEKFYGLTREMKLNLGPERCIYVRYVNTEALSQVARDEVFGFSGLWSRVI